VFARGTFEAPGVGDTGQAFVDALNSRLGGGAVDVYAVDYPASLDFQDAAEGVVDATNKVESIAATCPRTKIVLGGYSQGAAVAGYTVSDAVPPGYVLPAGITGPMPATIPPHVAAVTLFGKPSNGFLDVVDRSAPPIAIGQAYSAKALELCAAGDPVCGGGLDRAAHSAYKNNGMADQQPNSSSTPSTHPPCDVATASAPAAPGAAFNISPRTFPCSRGREPSRPFLATMGSHHRRSDLVPQTATGHREGAGLPQRRLHLRGPLHGPTSRPQWRPTTHTQVIARPLSGFPTNSGPQFGSAANLTRRLCRRPAPGRDHQRRRGTALARRPLIDSPLSLIKRFGRAV
jgi:cutinase